ncbi:MAG TPA: hypothetical protein VLV29_00950, partial [Steroidobacteraceae bacterium]|nr:hypothetical protein [Steroidobacteraceae bacterium]
AIVPLVPSPLSVRVLGQLYEFLLREEWTDLTLLPFFSMADRRRALHTELMAETRARFPQVLSTHVPYWSEIERMTQRRAPLPAFAPSSAAARVYTQLWTEMEERMPAELRAAPSQPLGSGAAPGAGAGAVVSTIASTA